MTDICLVRTKYCKDDVEDDETVRSKKKQNPLLAEVGWQDMKYPAKITLLAEGGREAALFHSPFLCHVKFNDQSINGYGIRLIFDTDSLWNLGETRDCFIELTGFEKLSDINWKKKFSIYEGKKIGEGVIEAAV